MALKQGHSAGGAGGQEGSLGFPTHPDISFGFNIVAQYNVEIHNALVSLAEVGVHLSRFNHDTVVRVGFTVDQFLKMARAYTSHTSIEVRSELISIGIMRGFYGIPSRMNVQGFVDLCHFLKTEEGQQFVRETYKTLVVKKNISSFCRVDLGALCEALSYQLQEMEAEREKVREEYEGRITDLWRQIRQLVSNRDMALASLSERFMSNFEDVNAECYAIYAAKAWSEGEDVLPPEEYRHAKAREMIKNWEKMRQCKKPRQLK